RGLGGELEARIETPATLMVGSLGLAAGGGLGGLGGGPAAMIAAGALIGLGGGIVRALTLRMSMRRMGPGRAPAVWHVGADGGLWIGGMLWGVALASGVVGAGALVVSVVVLALGGAVAFRRRQRC